MHMSINPSLIAYIDIMNNTELHLEVLSYNDEYVYALEVGNDPYELVINSYLDEDDITTFNTYEREDEYDFTVGEIFLYEDEPYIVTQYNAPSCTIYGRRVHKAVSIPLIDIEMSEEFDDICDYYISQDNIIYNKEV